MKIVFNLQKDIKQSFGKRILDEICDSVKSLRAAYRAKQVDIKYENIKELEGHIEDISLLFKLLFEIGEVPKKNQANLSKQFGEIMMQINGWKVHTDKTIYKVTIYEKAEKSTEGFDEN